MKHDILLKPSYSTLRLVLDTGESIRAESGVMLGMDSTCSIEGKMEGGLFSGLKRALLTSESFFVTTITSSKNESEVYLAPRATGDIVAIALKDEEYMVQGGSFLASDSGVTSDAKFTGWKGFLSGEGIFMIKVRGNGTLFVSSFGGIFEKTLKKDEEFIVDNGHIVAFPASMKYDIKQAGSGMMGMVTTGEGFVTAFTGPGTMYLQSRNLRSFAESLNPFLPDRNKSQGSALLGNVFGS